MATPGGQIAGVSSAPVAAAAAASFARLIEPMGVDAFLERLWEKEPHHFAHGDRRRFDDVFSAAELDRVIEFGRPRPPEIRVVSLGENVKPSDFQQDDGRPDVNQLRRLFAEGNTIVLNGLDRFSPSVAAFVQAIQAYVAFRVTPNAYLTPRGSQGLQPHLDNHDVFVVQLAGAKTWRIYHQAESCPLSGTIAELALTRETLPEPRLIELSEGDVLYIPRGWVHDAETGRQSSLHLTLGFHPPQWYDVLQKALTALALKDVRLRRALPVGLLNDRDALQILAREMRALAGVFAEAASAEDTLGMLQDEHIRCARARPDGRFLADLDRLDAIEPGTRLVRRAGLSCRVIPHEDSVLLQFARSVVRGPVDHLDAMTFVASNAAPFDVADLPIEDPGRRVSLARRLVRDGLLTFAADNVPSAPSRLAVTDEPPERDLRAAE
jgi:ribosomal protein L16 Arg81 hydroxylase